MRSAAYEALRTGAGMVTDAHEIVWVHGPDTVSFLDGLLSQNIAAMASASVSSALLLSPRGKLRATAFVMKGEDEVGIVTDAGRGGVVADDLARFRIRVDVTIAAPEPLVALWGPEAGSVIRSCGVPVSGPAAWVRAGRRVGAAVPLRRSALPRFVVSGIATAALMDAGAVPANAGFHRLRIELGEPIVGIDLDESTIPQEAELVAGAVDFDKGCYLGQELVARIDSRGHVNRLLRGVTIDGADTAVGTGALTASGREVGRVTSVEHSGAPGRFVGLALVRTQVAPGDTVQLEWASGTAVATVRELPLATT